MIQVILGSTKMEGTIYATFIKNITDEEFNFEVLSSTILEGMNKTSELFTDTQIITSLSQSGLNTIFDLLCLKANLRSQKIELIVTQVANNVSDANNDAILKVISPIQSTQGINRAIDFGFDSSNQVIDMSDVISTINTEYGLYNPDLFVDNPITAILNELPLFESKGFASAVNSAQNQLIESAKDLGFEFIAIMHNED